MCSSPNYRLQAVKLSVPGSAFIAADLELSLQPRVDHATYIESWLRVLKSDKRAISSAAAHAQRAADHLHSLQKPESAVA